MTKTIIRVAIATCLLAGSTFASAQQNLPSRQYRPAGTPPVSVRPTSGQQQSPLNSRTPSRVSQQQLQQFKPGTNSSSNVPPRVHSLSDSEMPNLSAIQPNQQPPRQNGFNTPSNFKVPPVIQKTAYLKQQDETPKGTEAPFVPEILKEKKSSPSPQLPTAPIASPKKVDAPARDSLRQQSLNQGQLPQNPINNAPQTSGQILPSQPGSSNGIPANTPVVDKNSFAPIQNTSFQGDSKNESVINSTVESFNSTNTNQEQFSQSNTNDVQNAHRFDNFPTNHAQGGQSDLEVKSAIPGITVATVGPKSIAAGKTSSYQIRVSNASKIDSSRLELNIRLPKWVNVTNVITTDGHRDLAQEPGNHLVKWVLSRVSTGSDQTMTIDVVPQKPDAFDLDVQWAIEPVKSVAKIAVTQPRLEMSIVGPEEVQFGQKALYNVTVKNVGTGVAEGIQVMLSEALGGARGSLDPIEPGKAEEFQVELSARSPGELDLLATAVGDSNVRTSASKKIMVRRAKLDIAVVAPTMKYAGTESTYEIRVRNSGDSLATDVAATVNLPMGVKYMSGLTGATANRNSLSWAVGNLAPGEQRVFKVKCQLNAAGNVRVDVGVRGANDLVAANFVTTKVETIADLVLAVEDPKGPLPTGEQIAYTIKIKNRGSRTANKVDLVMHFSDGIEPSRADGLKYTTGPGEITFAPIESIEPGEEVAVKVIANATQPGTHRFRAKLSCVQSDSLEVAEGTTKFYGNSIQKEGVPTRPASSTSQFQQNNQLPPNSGTGNFGGK